MTIPKELAEQIVALSQSGDPFNVQTHYAVDMARAYLASLAEVERLRTTADRLDVALEYVIRVRDVKCVHPAGDGYHDYPSSCAKHVADEARAHYAALTASQDKAKETK